MNLSLTHKLMVASLLVAGSLLAGCGSSPELGGTVAASTAAPVVAEATAAPQPSATAAPTVPAAPTATAMPSPTTQPTPMPSMAAHSHSMAPEAATPEAQPTGEEVQADIKLFQYKPDPIEIAVGSTVVWTNQDDIEHSVTNGTPAAPGAAFDSGLFQKGALFSFTFTKAGEYLYFCTRHNSMQGRVNVTAASGAADAPSVAQSQAAPPERLVIPAIKLDLEPVAVGLDQQNSPVVPRHDVGWFAESAQPGQGSNVIFWGHVLRWKNTPATPAPFERIHELQVGAEITVFTQRQPRRYRVTDQIWVRPENVFYLLPTAEERLTFVSCIGDNVVVTGTLTKEFRLVTIAEPLL